MSTIQYQYENKHDMDKELGSQNFEDHVATFKPQHVPLNTTLTSANPLRTSKNNQCSSWC